MNRRIRANFFLLITSFIWGSAFVAQSVGMEHIGPFTFNCVRMLVAGMALTPVVWLLGRKGRPARGENEKLPAGNLSETPGNTDKNRRTQFIGGLCCGAVLVFSSATQQVGLLYTTAGKAGFITSLYIIIVPLLGLFLKKRVGKLVWFCVLLAIVGIYLLSMDADFTMNRGDFLMLFSALGFALHILVIDYFSPRVDGVRMSRTQFLVCGCVSSVPMFVFESPEIMNILISWVPILYTGAISGGLAYTLQIIAQKDTTPTVAALILSFESVFAVLCGFLILNEILSTREIFGCVLMFVAIILAQLPDKSAERKLKN